MSLYQKQKAEEEGGEQNWILRIWLAHIFIKYTTAIIAMPYVCTLWKYLFRWKIRILDLGFSNWIIHHIFVELLWLLVFLGIASKAKKHNSMIWDFNPWITSLDLTKKKQTKKWNILLSHFWSYFEALLQDFWLIFKNKTIWPEYVYRILFFKPC